jgi:BirA family biotin operon repressor/biotin-[acetyl-CoA-carboxylase] ligase
MTAPGWLGHRRVELATCTSTSDVALAEARAGAAHGTVVVADSQTAGRGRLGRRWASPPGRHLYLSIVLRGPLTARPPAERAVVTLALGVGVVDAVRAAGAAAAALKWPNDVLVDRRKLAGILCETTGDAIVAGIGVNLGGVPDELPPEVAGRATTLEAVLGAPVDRAAFPVSLLAAVEPWLDRFTADGPAPIIEAWQARMAPDLRLGWEKGGRTVAGRADGLDPDGALRLVADDGEVHRVLAGDVAVVT